MSNLIVLILALHIHSNQEKRKMRKVILFYSLLVLSLFVIVPQVSAAHVPVVLFTKKIAHTYTPVEEPQTTVAALEINGFDLFLTVAGESVTSTNIGDAINPTVKLGNVALTVLSKTMIGVATRQRLIVQLPSSFIPGSYDLAVDNLTHASFFWLTLGAVGPTGPTGAASTVAGPTGPTGAASTVAGPTGPKGATGADSTVVGPTGPRGLAGDTSTKAWINFNGRVSPATIRAQSGITSVTRESKGEYTITFATAFADTNYVMTATASNGIVFIREINAAYITIYLLDTAGRLANGKWIMLQFISN